jgi:hypothetical protein
MNPRRVLPENHVPDQFKVLWAIYKIDSSGMNNQAPPFSSGLQEVEITFMNFAKVISVNILFIRSATLPDVGFQSFLPCMQKNQKIRMRDALTHDSE